MISESGVAVYGMVVDGKNDGDGDGDGDGDNDL